MSRGELIGVVVQTIRTHRLDRFSRREMAEAILDKVEPLIRADQDNRECDHCTNLATLEITNFRKKLKEIPSQAWGTGKDGHTVIWINRDDVLALLNESIK
jgi:nitrate/TMAO reductase-like tetraheme cytochrome c subunit